jgi:prepilin-type processing-associated H-X9-DG protein
MPKLSRKSQAGLSLLELIVLVAVMGLLAMVILPLVARARFPAHKIKCVNNLKNVGLAFRIFATDNNDLFPPALMVSNGVDVTKIEAITVFRALSNELSTPIILYCEKDTKRKKANGNFDTMTVKNISYFASLSANETNPLSILAGDRNLMTNGKPVGSGVSAMLTNAAGAWSWSREIHEEQGNIAMADGSVQQMANVGPRFTNTIADQGMATNWLAIP